MSYWDTQAGDMESARWAVWADEDWELGVRECVGEVESGIGEWLTPGAFILDYGCGVGRLTLPLAAKHPSCYILGYDPSMLMLDIARQQILTLPVVLRRVGFTDELLVEDFFDAVFSMCVIQHLPPHDVRELVRNAAGALKVGGVLHVQYVNFTFDGTTHHRPNGPHSHDYTFLAMSGWFAEAGVKFSDTFDSGVSAGKGAGWVWMTGRKI